MVTKRRTRTITRYVKRKTRRKKSFTLPIAVLAGFLPGVISGVSAISTYGWQGATTIISRNYLGFDPQSKRFVPGLMWGGTFPLLLGLGVHMVASRLGVNRMLGRIIPVIRI